MIYASLSANSNTDRGDIISFEGVRCVPSINGTHCDLVADIERAKCSARECSALRDVLFHDDSGSAWTGIFIAGRKGTLDSSDERIEIFPGSPVVLVFLRGNAYWVDVSRREVTSCLHACCEDYLDMRAGLIYERQWFYTVESDYQFTIRSVEGIVYQVEACCLRILEITKNDISFEDCSYYRWRVRFDEL